MQIRVHSDIHLEFQDWRPPRAAADVVVLAGDIHNGVDGLHWARSVFADSEIVYVAGNHEYYDHEVTSLQRQLRTVARPLRIHFLEADEARIGGVRFLGATLWTAFNFELHEATQVADAMQLAQLTMPDYRIVRTQSGVALSPQDTVDMHRAQVAWLARKLAEPCDGPTVVVTHHLPHATSVHPKYADSPLNAAFVTHLPELVRAPVNLWIHGHTHESADYATAGTRVVCNPRGYIPKEPNEAFEPAFVVSLDAP
jgi:predicted phosphodiesterase